MKLGKPSKGRVTQPFSSTHKAIDFGWGNGKQVFAAESGTAHLSSDRNYGLRIFITHTDGSQTEYSHLNSRLVRDGAHVDRGDQIGVMGNSGSYALFVHLHFAHWVDGKKVRPIFGAPSSIPAGETITPLPAMKDIDMFVIRAKNYYLVGIDQAHKIDAGEAAAWQSQLGGGKVAAVSSERARLLITAAARNGNKSAEQIASLTQGETGVSEADAQKIAAATVDEIKGRL